MGRSRQGAFYSVEVTQVSQSAGTGGTQQSIQSGDLEVGFTPMLLLGYDMK